MTDCHVENFLHMRNVKKSVMWRNNVYNLWCFVAFYTVFLQKPVCRDLPAFDKYHEWPLIPPSAGEKVWDWDMRWDMQVVQIISRLAELQSVIKLPLTVCSLLQKPIYRWHITYLGHDYHNIVVGWRKPAGHGHRVLRASIGVFSVELLHIFSFFFNFTFFQRRTFTYFHQRLHLWYHHHCFHCPIQI